MRSTKQQRRVRSALDARAWLDGAIVGGYAVAAGLGVAAFSMASNWAFAVFEAIYRWNPWASLCWTPVVAAATVWLSRRWVPGAVGSGIPQVMAATALERDPIRSGQFASLRLSAAKIALSAGAFLGGLSVGREGPAVQIAAGIMGHAKRWLSPASGIGTRALLIAGGAAGVASAFNAPFSGAVFAVEQLGQGVQRRAYRWVILCVFAASIAAACAVGNRQSFETVRISPAIGSLVWPGLFVAIVCGLAGGLLARLLIRSLAGDDERANHWRIRWPVGFASFCGLAVAGIGLASNGVTFGSGSDVVEQLLKGQTTLAPIDTLMRFIATWLTSWCGTPGGILAPSLSIGAGIGDGIAQFVDPAQRSTLIAIGMAAFLAAVTQTPLTAAVIVMEMVGGETLVLALVPAATIACFLSRWISRPLYATLAAQLLDTVARSTSSAASIVANPARGSRPESDWPAHEAMPQSLAEPHGSFSLRRSG